MHVAFNGASWSPVRIVDTVNGQFMSLAFGPSGQPAVSYHDSGGDDLRYSYGSGSPPGSTWTTNIVDGAGKVGPIGQYCSLAFGPDGQPAISYRDDTSPAARSLQFARFNGTAWTLSTVFTGDAQFTSLAFGPDGQPAIAFYDTGPGADDLKLARRGVFSP